MTADFRSKPREYMVASAVGIVSAQFVIGLLEAFWYQSNAPHAYASEQNLRGNFVGAVLTGFHYWASVAFLVVTMALLVETVWNGGYRNLRRYYGTIALAVIAFVFQLTGNLLPMDRHGVQTAVVEASISSRAPVVGPSLHNLMLRGSEFSGATLGLWWMAHAYLLPLVAIVACVMVSKDLKAPKWAFGAVPLIVLVLGALVHAPLGDPATQVDFGEGNAAVSWYTWPLHAMMVLANKLPGGPGWIGSMLVPGIVFVALLALPFMRAKLAPHAIRLGVAVVAVAFLGVSFVLGGPVAKLTGNRDPAKEIINTGPVTKAEDAKTLALVKTGRDLFNSANTGCADCHGVNGAKGDGGPDLTLEYRKHSDIAWYVKLIRNPKSVNPSSTMPAFPALPEDQVTAIATFLSQAP